MGRIRTIKPEIAKHELLFALEQETKLPIRFAWAVLPTACDREGRFKWRPVSMKTDILPYDGIDFGLLLTVLVERGFLIRYRCGGEWFGQIPTFTKHQFINGKESASVIPPVEDAEEVITYLSALATRDSRVDDASRGEGKGKEGIGNGRSDSSASLLDAEPALLTFPTTGQGPKTWALRERQVADWQSLYPGLDILGECRRALAWVQANQLKTAKGMPAFLVNWFNREVQRGGNFRPTASAATSARRGSSAAWLCPHVETCTHRAACAHKDTMPEKYPRKEPVSA